MSIRDKDNVAPDFACHTPEDIKAEHLLEIEADPLRHIIKNQEIILKMLEDVLELLKDIKYPQWRDNGIFNSVTPTSATATWFGIEHTMTQEGE